jgi:hypothetical protein
MGPRYSVLLPTHDRAEVVGFAIRSVLAQSEPDFELLIVGDGCTDGTADVVDSFADDRIRWFDLPKAPNFGYANRNIALREARGDLVAFMAHDDLLAPDHLELMAKAFESDQVEWAYSRPLWVDDNGTVVPFAFDLRRPDALESFMSVGNKIPASCIVHRRSCLDRYGYWPEEITEAGDWELWRRFLGPSRGANLAYEPSPTCMHFRARWRTGNVWGPEPLQLWLDAATSGWWPEELRLGIRSEALPQAHVWQTMTGDPETWRRIRSAVVAVIDGFAWGGAEQTRQNGSLEQSLAVEAEHHSELERALARQAEHNSGLEQALRAQQRLSSSILASRSWRVMAPGRGIGRLLRAGARSLKR